MAESDLDPVIVDAFVNNMPRELLGKPVLLSNGEIGAIHTVDFDDLEYPYIRTSDKIIKSNYEVHCVHMYFEDELSFIPDSEKTPANETPE